MTNKIVDQRIEKTLSEILRTGYILGMVQDNPNLGRITQEKVPGFGPILSGLGGLKSEIDIPERGEYPKEMPSCFSGLTDICFDLDTGILNSHKREDFSSKVNIDIMDRDYKFLDCEQDMVYQELNRLYDMSHKEHNGFYDFFEKEEYCHCSLFDILAGRAERLPRVMMPNDADRGTIKLMEDKK